MPTVAIAKSAPAHLVKGKLGVYFAWGAFSKHNNAAFTDSHGDQIPDDEMIAGALSLAKSAQLGHEHDGTITGSVPLVMPLTEDVQAAFSLTGPHAGLGVGFTPTAEVAKSLDAAIEAGEPWQMSIEGEALAELVKATVAKSADAVGLEKAEHRRTLRKLRIDKIDLVRAAAHGVGTSVVLAKRAGGVIVKTSFAVGDSVTVKAGSEHDPAHAGMVWTVAEIDGTAIALKHGDMVHRWYIASELEHADAAAAAADMEKAMKMKCAACGASMTGDMAACPKCGSTKKPIAKRAPALTDPTNGHQHAIYDVEESDGGTSYEVAPGSEYGHSHPWVRLADGTISIGETAGHTHTVTTSENATMADDVNKSLLAAQADIAKARKLVDDVLALPADQLAYAKRLDGAGLAVFVAKRAAERAALAKPVHVAKSGEVFYATDDARLVSMAKANDAMADQLEVAKAAAVTAEIAKSVTAVPHVKDAALLVKAAYLLPEAERAQALAALATVDASIGTITRPIGKGSEPAAVKDAEGQLEELAKGIAKDKGVSFAKAFDLALETPDGAALYARAEAAKRTAAGN